jgi:hypothetical protein
MILDIFIPSFKVVRVNDFYSQVLDFCGDLVIINYISSIIIGFLIITSEVVVEQHKAS